MQTLEQKLQSLPNNSGIYQYFDENGKLLYVGKAKNLKNRVKSYFKFTPYLQPANKLSYRINRMISQTFDMNYIITPSENDALILENSLIKQLKPKYNILLRDDKTYPYIYIDTSEDFPRLEITRKVITGSKIKYFGPYSTGARDMLDSIYEIVPLVQKKSCIKGGKACLFYQIEKCLAPCEGKITKEEYHKLIDEALDYINNKNKLIKKLEEKMNFFSEQFRFEEAMQMRDRITTIKKSELKSSFDFANDEMIDLFAIEQTNDNQTGAVVRMYIRTGKLVSSTHSFIRQSEQIDLQEAYKTAIVNYYSQDLPILPKEIIVPISLEDKQSIENFIQERHNKKIIINTPQRGKKKQLIDVSLSNARELLKINKQTHDTTFYHELQTLFDIQNLPQRCEAFDNSHMMGQATVGSMIVYENEKFIKSDYRHYNLEAKDEYAQMKEMLLRRVESFEKNPPPDLWIIDGGKTLLDLAMDIINSSGANVDCIAIAKQKLDAKAYRAKGAARDIIHTKNGEIKLEPSDKRLHFVQKLRDETHNFAIKFHKKQKVAQDKQISLLNLHGIGEAKVTKLLQFFGDFETIKNASLEQLKEVINSKDSQTIFDFYHKE